MYELCKQKLNKLSTFSNANEYGTCGNDKYILPKYNAMQNPA